MKIAHCARITRWLHTTPAPARSSLRPGHPPQRPVSGMPATRRGRVAERLAWPLEARSGVVALSVFEKAAVLGSAASQSCSEDRCRPMRTGITTLCTARAGRLGGRDGCNRINQRASRVLTLDPTRAESPEQMPLDNSKPMTGLIMIGYGRRSRSNVGPCRAEKLVASSGSTIKRAPAATPRATPSRMHSTLWSMSPTRISSSTAATSRLRTISYLGSMEWGRPSRIRDPTSESDGARPRRP